MSRVILFSSEVAFLQKVATIVWITPFNVSTFFNLFQISCRVHFPSGTDNFALLRSPFPITIRSVLLPHYRVKINILFFLRVLRNKNLFAHGTECWYPLPGLRPIHIFPGFRRPKRTPQRVLPLPRLTLLPAQTLFPVRERWYPLPGLRPIHIFPGFRSLSDANHFTNLLLSPPVGSPINLCSSPLSSVHRLSTPGTTGKWLKMVFVWPWLNYTLLLRNFCTPAQIVR